MVVEVMSQGPLMLPPAQVSTSCPIELSTRRHPAAAPCGVPASPGPLAVVGRLPTTTHPPGSTDSAVVSPIPPGQGPDVDAWLICANWLTEPSGISCTMVVPVPWALAASLKLLTSTPPRTRFPVLEGTTTIPYGLTSPLAGTVDGPRTTLSNWLRNPCGSACAAPLVAMATPEVVPASEITASSTAQRRVGHRRRLAGPEDDRSGDDRWVPASRSRA